MANAEVVRLVSASVDAGISDWREHAAQSQLACLVHALRGDEKDTWLDAAVPRLPETVRLNPLRNDLEWTRERLVEFGAEPIEWYTGPGGAFVMPWPKSRTPNEKLRCYIQSLHGTGRITQQEAASMMPVQALNITPENRVLDLCAAPGSKTTQIAEMLGDEGFVVANEVNPGRANHLVSNLHRSGHLNVVITQHDGRQFPRVAMPGFDRVLVDVPCTGTGTTRKNTDVWSKWKPWAGRSMHRLQRDLLKRGAMLLRPGGLLVYSTCSIDPLENEAVVADALRTFPWLELVEISKEKIFPGLTCRSGLATWPLLADDCSIVADEEEWSQLSGWDEALAPPVEENIQHSLPRCIRVWNDENDGGGFFIAVFSQAEQGENAARASRPHPRDIGRDVRPLTPPKPGHNELRLPEQQEGEGLLTDWGIESEGLGLFRRGHYAHATTLAVKQWMWESPRTNAKHGGWPGGHWHPIRVLQAGQPAWQIRKGKNRLLSRGLHGLGARVTAHRHTISSELLRSLLSGEQPGRSELPILAEQGLLGDEVAEAMGEERDGGILLVVEIDGRMTAVPAWIAGKLSLMVPEYEQDVLRWMLERD